MDNLNRPDGSVVTPIGWALILLGVIGAFVAIGAGSLNGTLFGFALANLGFGLGVLLLGLGYLVRAIWFLPGRDIPREANAGGSETLPTKSCDWCGRQLPGRYRTCTSYDHESIAKISEKVADPVCKDQLRKRGYRVAGGDAKVSSKDE